ncbi:MAG: TIM44-like domain-containing protein [Sulfuritalea sp.]|nr:TIM44-like domain-containing protein [Sulfuritalea sp.]MDP1982213.1 TIM44-like domain-containing protein [Sulfuritalea sp.]
MLKRASALLCIAFPFASRFIPPALLLLASGTAHAVAGGAGGGSFDGGSDDIVGLLFELVFWILWSLPFPYNFIGLAIVFGLLWFTGRKTRAVSGLNKIPSIAAATARTYALPADFLKRNPGFDPQPLLSKANTAFLAIQEAWMKQDMAPVRRWISDGIWQRFNTQFAMMRLLGQQNAVSNIQIRNTFIAAIEQDGNFDIVHVGIHFSARDDFVSAKFPQLDQRGDLEMLEYWSFIRKAGVAEVSGKDLYHGNRCPGCGAELPADMGEVARCQSCHAISTGGDYDWILAEITQADDYANQGRKLEKSGALTQRIRSALDADAGFSVQLIEDKASNAYMQIMAAQATQRPETMRRFVGDALFERLAQEIAQQAPFVFNRLYLNNVTLIDYYRDSGRDHLVIAFKRTAQRVAIADGRLRLVDQGMYACDEIMILSRDAGAGAAQGALYAHACPACGGPVGDTLDLKCGYCGELLNSTQREWIVSDLMAAEKYQALAASHKPAMTTHVAVKQLDPLFAARDYAFSNIMMIIGSDGAITMNELAFAQQLSRQMGYDLNKLGGMFELAKNRKLALRLPSDRKGCEKVLKLMEKAALADKQVSPEESALLDEVRRRIEAMALN